MRKVFHFDAPRDKYQCDAAILWCFDNRFELGFRKFLKRIGVNYSDPIKIAGGAKCMASPEHESDREFVLEQIRKSIRLHGTRRVILMCTLIAVPMVDWPEDSGETPWQRLPIMSASCSVPQRICGPRFWASRCRVTSWTLMESGRRSWARRSRLK